MMESGYSLSDIAAVTDGNMRDGFGGGGFGWLILFALFLGGGFGGFGAGRQNVATTDEVAAGFNFAGINNKLNELTLGQANINQNLGNAICSSTYELASKIDNCCCNTQLAIKDLTATVVGEAAATRNMIQQDKIEALQAQVSQLQLAQAMCGVVKYPTATTYATACNPFGGTCGTCAF